VAIYAEMGRFPITIRYKIKTIKFWARLTRTHSNSIVKQVYNVLHHLSDLGFHTWVTVAKELMYENDLGDVFERNYVSKEEERALLSNLKILLCNQFREKCMSDLHSYPKLRCYVKFKLDFSTEHYLLNIKDFRIRKCIAQLRLSSHNLEIERGRFTKPITAEDNRICQHCNLNLVETEYHFLLICPYFDRERAILLNVIESYEPVLIIHNKVIDTFNNIMSCKSDKVLFSVGKYIFKCFRKKKM